MTWAKAGGVICPIVTPLRSDGHVNKEALEALIDAILHEVDGIFILGSSGEFPWLTDSQKREMLDCAVTAISGRCPLYAGAGDTSTSRTLEMVRELDNSDVDFIVLTPPYYFPSTDLALEQHFVQVASATSKPVILYNIPQNTHSVIRPEVVSSLSRHPSIVGIKDSSGDPFLFQSYLESAGDDFVVMQGREQMMLPSYIGGAKGIVSSLANIAPGLLSQVQAGFESRTSISSLSSLQVRINHVSKVFECGYWVSALKTVLSLRGYDVGSPVRPMLPSTKEEQDAIEIIMAEHERALIPSIAS